MNKQLVYLSSVMSKLGRAQRFDSWQVAMETVKLLSSNNYSPTCYFALWDVSNFFVHKHFKLINKIIWKYWYASL